MKTLLAIIALMLANLVSVTVTFAGDSAKVGTLNDGVLYVNATEAAEIIENNPEYIVLDVRTKGEFNSGHIADALQINYSNPNFKTQLKALDPEKTYVVHCRSGHRSMGAIKQMKSIGMSKIIHMDGGFNAWKAAGLPVQKS